MSDDSRQPTADSRGSTLARLLRIGLILLSVLAPAILVGSLYFGSATALLAFLCGRPLLAQYSGEIGDLHPGSPRPVKVKVTNLTWGEMEISGVHVGCYCIESISPDLPFTVGPHDAATLEIFVNPPKPRSGDAHFHETVVFFINGGREFLTIDMSGRVVTDRLEN